MICKSPFVANKYACFRVLKKSRGFVVTDGPDTIRVHNGRVSYSNYGYSESKKNLKLKDLHPSEMTDLYRIWLKQVLFKRFCKIYNFEEKVINYQTHYVKELSIEEVISLGLGENVNPIKVDRRLKKAVSFLIRNGVRLPNVEFSFDHDKGVFNYIINPHSDVSGLPKYTRFDNLNKYFFSDKILKTYKLRWV